MPLIETKGAASAQGFGEFAASSGPVNYIEDVFSTYLYTGNGSTQTITNGIDLSTKGGLVWIKSRSVNYHALFDTARGATTFLKSNAIDANETRASSLTSFNTTGFSLSTWGDTNGSGTNFASWTFRKQPKFFDIVTYTGTGSSRTIAHNLGSAPGFMIIKSTSAGDDWYCYHRSLSAAGRVLLNSTNPYGVASNMWNNTDPTSTVFTLGSDSGVNGSGVSYVAYLFAHNAGGFGLTGTDNVISCGSFVGNNGTNPVNLGYEAQLVLIKNTTNTTGSSNWVMYDNMRGLSMTSASVLRPNLTFQETSDTTIAPSATGFTMTGGGGSTNYSGDTYIYIAIRRGPMKVPTSGTSVFVPTKVTGSAIGQTYSIGFPSDLFFGKDTSGASYIDWVWQSRLTGDKAMSSDSTSAESITAWGDDGVKWTYQNSIYIQSTGYLDTSPILYTLRRAPGFFDEVCYTGTGAVTTVTHNLGVAPELMIVKARNGVLNWKTYDATTGATNNMNLNLNTASAVSSTNWNDTAPTASVFTVGTSTAVNGSGTTYVAYLFATCAGVSKVGSYTGTGAPIQVNCGFTGGARFVLIKKTSGAGDWYVWDTARGIVSGNDPYLLLNSTAAEVTVSNDIGPYSAGFEIPAASFLNATGATYIFLAIA